MIKTEFILFWVYLSEKGILSMQGTAFVKMVSTIIPLTNPSALALSTAAFSSLTSYSLICLSIDPSEIL